MKRGLADTFIQDEFVREVRWGKGREGKTR